MLAQDRTQRQFAGRLALRLHGREHWGFAEPATQPHANHPKHAAQQEGITPGVIEDFRRSERLRQEGRGQCADQITEGQPRLQETQGIAAMGDGCVLGDEYPGTGYLTAHRRALEDAQGQQQQGCEIADLRVGRHDPDQQAGQRHHQDAQAEDFLAPQAIGEVRHQDAAQRSRQVTGDENPEALQQAQPLGHFRREEQLAEGQGEKHENDEVVDFQRPAERGEPKGLVVRAAERRRARIGVGSHVKNSGTGKNQGAHGLRKRAGGQPVRPKSHSHKSAPQKSTA
ncbi:hypothetical protein D3C76_915480 [compost metagenome]